MTITDLVMNATSEDAGARFRRAALQVNSYAYLQASGARSTFADASEYDRAIVEACSALRIEAIGLTDHYSVQTSASLRAAAEAAGITVFPGFEAQTSDGVHLLVLFDPGTEIGVLERAIGECGVVRRRGDSPLGVLDVVELAETAHDKWHAIVIAAHVTTTGKGLLTANKGQPRIRAWTAPELLAVAIPGSPADLAEADRLIVENAVSDYRRPRRIAVINAQDVGSPEMLASPGATSLLKMSQISVEALRQAFLDPDSRIRLNSDPAPAPHSRFTELSWSGGFLDGVTVDLNENLNVLIGGRGAGKTCVIESIRYVLGEPALGPEAKRLHEGIVRDVVRSATKIVLGVRVEGPSARRYLIERTVPNPPIVRGADGAVLTVQPKDLLGRVEIYGQHEISELTKSPELLTNLLRRFVVLDEQIEVKRSVLRRQTRQNREEMMRLRDEISDLETRVQQLPGLEERLRAYEATGLEAQIQERSDLVPEARIVTGFAVRVNKLRAAVAALRTAVGLAVRPTATADTTARMPHAKLIQRAEGLFAELQGALDAASDVGERAIADAETKLTELTEEWNRARADVDARYAESLRKIEVPKIDAQAFIALREQIESLRPLATERVEQDARLAQHLTTRRALLVELEELRANEDRALASAAALVSTRLTGLVRVQVTAGAHRDAVGAHLRETLGGPLKPIIDQLDERDTLSVRELAAAIGEGPAALRTTFGFTAGQAERLSKLDEGARLELEEIELGPTTRIELNVHTTEGPPIWQGLDGLSTGQRATAILLLLLLESDTPLVIDQPEDDLDNRFISEHVVPIIKKEKRRRQFVFSSHNANIPVLGDAELIIGLEATAEHATVPPDQLGSIDKTSIRQLASEILEGGREAFELRRAKYDF
jgi:hypothetical protein